MNDHRDRIGVLARGRVRRAQILHRLHVCVQPGGRVRSKAVQPGKPAKDGELGRRGTVAASAYRVS